ncbi:MAG: OmpA family protein [Pseudobacteriovorax sp.]|nr:OmpA family protein [Pseudobacteriovorax sp.]
MLTTLKSVPRSLAFVGILSMILATSCTTTEPEVSEPEEFLQSLDEGPMAPIEDGDTLGDSDAITADGTSQAIEEQVAVSDELATDPAIELADDATSDSSDSNAAETGAKDDDEIEDFAIAKNYEAFDPAGIIVRFEFDSAELNADTIAALDKIVAGLKKDELAKIFVRGHADKQGPEGYNDALSQKRAKKIQDYLISNGISEDRLITVHLGETEPLVEGNTVSAFKQNRRGDFSLDYGTGAFSSK